MGVCSLIRPKICVYVSQFYDILALPGILIEKLKFFISIFTDPSITINPYIRHWEPAKYDRDHLDRSRRIHENVRRRKRDTNLNFPSNDYGIAHTVRLKFFAHDK